ncbi:hypothetical protein ElyMa_005525100 [Elysia marginata]|uniref:Asteroid domain-containing protein n=1 Tax=Elysia marginata TaxID=1093978 RepID=A0AAV4EVX8_9GAST|nr:hypothetical protein ElyMa_005525100 [Elysia marginata]
MVCNARKEDFLGNPKNKQAFLEYLGDVLKKDGCEVLHAEGDADTLIVNTAVICAVNATTVVIGEDTDLLVLLLYHADLRSRPLFLKSELKTKKHKVIDILLMKPRLGPEICNFLPFLHAINGCDTTSRLFGVAKGFPLKKIKTNADFKAAAETFCTKGKTTADIIASGEKALVSLYGGRAGDTLDMLRYKRLWEKVVSSITTVQVRSLPQTSAAAKYHSLRVYLQVQDWIDKICDLRRGDGIYLLADWTHVQQISHLLPSFC